MDQPLCDLLASIDDVTVLTAPDGMAPHLVDWRRRHTGQTDCIVFPATVQAVSAVLTLCYARGVKVFPQGGNTSVCATALPNAT